MLLAGCSTVCTTVAEAAKMWNLVVVSTYLLFFPPGYVCANLVFHRVRIFRDTERKYENVCYIYL